LDLSLDFIWVLFEWIQISSGNSNLNQFKSLKEKMENVTMLRGRQPTNQPTATFGPSASPASQPRLVATYRARLETLTGGTRAPRQPGPR
jgi:hypothetical protein